MDNRAIVYKALFGPRFRVCEDCFDSLSDRRSDERCEGAGKSACELLYSQSRVGEVGSQLFRAAECRSNIDTRQMVNEIMSDKVYAVCLNDTTISVK